MGSQHLPGRRSVLRHQVGDRGTYRRAGSGAARRFSNPLARYALQTATQSNVSQSFPYFEKTEVDRFKSWQKPPKHHVSRLYDLHLVELFRRAGGGVGDGALVAIIADAATD